MVISDIEQIFKPFMLKYNFVKTLGRFDQNFCIKNNNMYLEFFIDRRYNEVNILAYKDKLGKGVSILTLINKIKPDNFSDVFGFIKNEYSQLDDSIKVLKDQFSGDNTLLILSLSSILTKYFNQFQIVFNEEV